MKLTKEDNIILNALEDHRDLYIARNLNGNLYLFLDDKPCCFSGYWDYTEYGRGGYQVYLKNKLFAFIEKGRIWSKAELMELEVVE